MLAPNGNPGENIKPIILLSMWVKHLEEEIINGVNKKHTQIISSFMGKPTYPIRENIVSAAIDYWKSIQNKLSDANSILISAHTHQSEERSSVAKLLSVVDYGDPRGELFYREKMARALNDWYGEGANIDAEHLLFTVGGTGALHNIFSFLNRKYINSLIVTPFPYYTFYSGTHNKNNLFPIHVMQTPGFRLTANQLLSALEAATQKAKKNNTIVSAFLLCNPNNPLGTVLTENELLEIASILREYPKLLIILDEVYSEMVFTDKKPPSLLTLAPDLKDRMIIMRSATKALSAAGERMAVTLAFDSIIMDELISENSYICVHAPISSQHIFSESMEKISMDDLENIKNYYLPQVRYVEKRLREIGAAMPDPNYKVMATFYVIADLSSLLGNTIPNSAYRALNKKEKMETDVDIAYSLLFEEGIALMPLSFFGHDPKAGYLRITCSIGDADLCKILDRLNACLIKTRGEIRYDSYNMKHKK